MRFAHYSVIYFAIFTPKYITSQCDILYHRIENRIKSYQLIKDVDYFTISRKYEIDGFTESKDILDNILTLDCVKQLAMVESTDIGYKFGESDF